MEYYIGAFKNYANFNGRARRKEYWMFVLFNVIVAFVIGIIAGIIHFSWLSTLYSLAVLCPSLALCFRRLRDIGKSGVWILVSLIPLVGWIWMLILLCKDSDPGANQYGENPKGM